MTMKLSAAALLLLTGTGAAFVPSSSFGVSRHSTTTTLKGYLDDLSDELYAEVDNPDLENQSREETDAKTTENYGVQDWSGFVDFDEFDGGDGQMGVAGDGNKGLEKFGDDTQPQLVKNLGKSKMMSAKNAWGTSTGYSDELREKGVDTARAQQLENWQNQQELRKRRLDHSGDLDSFDTEKTEEDWRQLASFGIERTQEFDYDEEFGAVTPGDQIEGTIELSALIGKPAISEFQLTNQFMGFADFRAAFTSDTSPDWTVEPHEGTLSKEPVTFIVRFRPQNPGTTEGYLVIETEDFKKTYKLIGGTA